MPHLIVEYSSNLTDFPETQALAELNAAVCASPEIPHESNLKTRIVRHACFAVGTAPAARGFVHAQLRLLSGRSVEARQDLAARIAEVLRRLVPRPHGIEVQLTVEVVDMERDAYVRERL